MKEFLKGAFPFFVTALLATGTMAAILFFVGLLRANQPKEFTAPISSVFEVEAGPDELMPRHFFYVIRHKQQHLKYVYVTGDRGNTLQLLPESR